MKEVSYEEGSVVVCHGEHEGRRGCGMRTPCGEESRGRLAPLRLKVVTQNNYKPKGKYVGVTAVLEGKGRHLTTIEAQEYYSTEAPWGASRAGQRGTE